MNFDLRPIIYVYNIRNLPKSFEQWREDLISHVNLLCRDHREEKDMSARTWLNIYNNFRNFPKHIVRITRQMCSCDERCVAYSMHYVKFDELCTFYDLNELLTDNLYYSSSFINKKVVYKRLESKTCELDEFNLKKEIHSELVKLCDKKDYNVSQLKCALFELKDHCQTNFNCIKNMIDYDSVLASTEKRLDLLNCKNRDFDLAIGELKKNIQHTSFLRPKRELKEIKSEQSNQNYIYLSILLPMICLLVYLLKARRYKLLLIFVGLCMVLFIGEVMTFH